MKKMIFMFLVFMTVANLYAEEINRHNVTDEMANPNRVKADDLFYAKLGYGGIFGGNNDCGTHFGYGYRNEMDDLAVDIGFLNYIIGQQNDELDHSLAVNLLQIQALYFFSPIDNSSFYAGGGLAYNIIYLKDNHNKYKLNGIAGMATLGYEIMRASTVRLFFQIEATVPFNKMKNDYNKDDSHLGSSIAMSMGIGF